ncbi:monovalent cation/H(+) antiporter subunit G [bacterium]|jgi:multicomponent Na+:H+ antiporter subunit G|nr:sodium:proton antiporter [Gemmatimonadota bacterium]MCH2659307.1 monovalent cation/H(+) antiporter subunit G [bacterium]|tara:strand:+ start:901 stop:1215 length:315 start_codon:yes stop_codon:yes gene_type:complete
MEALVYFASWACLLLGSAFCIIGGIGLIRLPDFYSRIHGGGITDTLGAGLVMLGLMLQAGWSLVTVKLVLIMLFLLLTSPVASHAIARAARHSGLEPKLAGEDA